MKLSQLALIFGLLFALPGLKAQDIHYTLYNMSPLLTNPALTGAYSGSIRVGGIYRSQWYTIENYSTPSFFVDAPILRGLRDQDWIGAGLVFVQDNVGPLSQTQFSFSGAYHLGLNKKQTSMLTIAAQFGGITRKADPNDFRSQQLFGVDIGGENNPSQPDVTEGNGAMLDEDGNLERSFNDISAGLLFRTNLDKSSKLELGFAMRHIGAPEYNLIRRNNSGTGTPAGLNENDRPSTYLIHGTYINQLNEKWSIEPTFMYQTTAGMREINLQAWLGRRINPDVKINFGLGYRFNDAAKALLGLEYKDLRAALSYDFTLSSAGTLTNNNGGPEIAAYYIFKIYKQPDLTPSILCPQF